MGDRRRVWKGQGRRWPNHGKRGLLRALCLAILLGISCGSAPIGESVATAALLKNGVKPGNRSGMHIVRPPAAGARKRIFAPGERRQSSGPSPQGVEQHAWFWKLHPTTAVEAGARWNAVIETFAERRKTGKALTRAPLIEGITAAYGGEMATAAALHRISPALVAAVIAVESAGRPAAVSPKGAAGLMQLIPSTARRFGVSQSFDAAQNIAGGAAYLDWLLTHFRGDIVQALAGYNAGENAVGRHGGVPPYRETRDYVVKVLDALVLAGSYCKVPPTGPRAPCEWR